MVDVTVVASGHDVADARLHRLVSAMSREGLRIEILGLGDSRDGPVGVEVVTEARGGLVRRGVRAFRYAWRAQGSVLLAPSPDSLVAALVVGRARGRRTIADVHEDYLAALRDRAWAHGWRGLAGRTVARLAVAMGRLAPLVLVADDHVPPLTARRRLVVRNYPDLEMLPEPIDRHPGPRAIYIGDLRESRGLWDMVEAVRLAPGWELDLVGGATPETAARLRQLEAAPDLAGRLRWHGRKPPLDAWRLAQGTWLGLCLLHDTQAYRAAMPSKLYEYLATGLPVLATDLPRQREFLDGTGAGVVVQPDRQVAHRAAELLRRWQEDPAPLDQMRAAASDWRERHLSGSEYADVARAVAELARDSQRRSSRRRSHHRPRSRAVIRRPAPRSARNA